jgi:type IV pilus assembly protein PilF
MKGLVNFLVLTLLIVPLTTCTTVTRKPNAEAAKYNLQLGLAYLKHGDVARAKSKLLLALHENPNDPIILDAMGYFFELTHDLKIAQRYYLQAIKIMPNAGAVHNNYGTYLCRHGYYRKAIEHFLLATKDINYLHVAAAYKNAGLCALKIQDKKLAREYLQKAIQNDPSEISVIAKLAKPN